MLISKYLIPLAAASSEISITTLLGQILQCLGTWGWHGAGMEIWKPSGKDSLKGRRGNLFDCGKVLLEGVQAHLDDEVVQSEKILGDNDWC